MRALIVDDSAPIRRILRQMLGTLGYEVFEVSQGEEAMGWLKSNGRVDVALVDYYMPGMDGPQLVRHMRAEPAMKDTCLLMVTSGEDIANVETAVEAGVDQYLVKPFTLEKLKDKLQRAGALTPA